MANPNTINFCLFAKHSKCAGMYSLSTKFNQLCELWCANALKGYYIPKPTTIGRKRFYSLQLCAGYARTKHFECSRHFAFRLEPDPPFHAPDTLCVTRNKTPNNVKNSFRLRGVHFFMLLTPHVCHQNLYTE